MSEPGARTGIARESAVERQVRLRARIARQRDALDAHWQSLVPAIGRIDVALSRLRRLREHPFALALLATTASGALVTRRGRRLFGTLRAGWRLGLRAATLVSVWKAVRGGPRRRLSGATMPPARGRRVR